VGFPAVFCFLFTEFEFDCQLSWRGERERISISKALGASWVRSSRAILLGWTVGRRLEDGDTTGSENIEPVRPPGGLWLEYCWVATGGAAIPGYRRTPGNRGPQCGAGSAALASIGNRPWTFALFS